MLGPGANESLLRDLELHLEARRGGWEWHRGRDGYIYFLSGTTYYGRARDLDPRTVDWYEEELERRSEGEP
jgi:hypothetical protein